VWWRASAPFALLKENNRRLWWKTASIYIPFILSVILPVVALGSSSSWLPAITEVEKIREMTPGEAGAGFPVRIDGIVTYTDHFGYLFVQDHTAGIFVSVVEKASAWATEPGQRVTVTGVTDAGEYAPIIRQGQVELHGVGQMPKPIILPFDKLMNGTLDSQWISVEGIVQSGEVSSGRLNLNIAASGGHVIATLAAFPKNWMDMLVDARVEAQGVMEVRFNSHRQLTGLRICVPRTEFIRIEEPPGQDPYKLELLRLSDFGRFAPQRDSLHRVHVRGVVSGLEDEGDGFTLSDGYDNVYVRKLPDCTVQVNQMVDVAGFPRLGGRPTLEDATCRGRGAGRKLTPAPVKASELLVSGGRFDKTESPFDMALVTLEGVLLEETKTPTSYVLTLRSEDQVFTATLPIAGGESVQLPEAGSKVRVTGVCVTTFDRFQKATAFMINMRAVDDLALLRRPAWWGFKHALWVFGIMTALIAAVLAWVAVLRAQVRYQTAKLQRSQQQLEAANEQLKALAETDGLTGLFNSRRFKEILTAEVERGKRQGPLSLLMVDMNKFKNINDEHGHQTGDEALKLVAGAIKESSRSTDFCARYGGDEFAVLLPGTPATGAAIVRERVLSAVRDLRLQTADRVLGLSVSIGIASFPDEASSAHELVELADAGMYEIKRARVDLPFPH
jgi:diguanylate cyclase (GGDEF)-like protein